MSPVRSLAAFAVAVPVFAAASADAGVVFMVGGLTSVRLNYEALQTAAGLTFAGYTEAVIVPGNLGPDSAGFVVTPPIAAEQPTTFSYDSDDWFATLTGTIGHRGSIVFNEGAVVVGNFDIFFSEGAFRVADTVSGLGVLFDVEATSANATASSFVATGNLFVSSNLAQLLITLGFTEIDLTGALVGDALIEGFMVVPAPGAVVAFAAAGLFARRRRR